MSVFSAKIFLATDGTEEVELTARIVADLARSSGSEPRAVIIFAESA